jgi:hypothetical protein
MVGLVDGPEAERLQVDEMTVGSIGVAEVAGGGVAIEGVENVAEESVGVVVGLWREGEGSATQGGTFEGGKEGELPIGGATNEQAEVGQVGVVVEDGEESLERKAVIGFGEFFDARFGRCMVAQKCIEGHG